MQRYGRFHLWGGWRSLWGTFNCIQTGESAVKSKKRVPRRLVYISTNSSRRQRARKGTFHSGFLCAMQWLVYLWQARPQNTLTKFRAFTLAFAYTPSLWIAWLALGTERHRTASPKPNEKKRALENLEPIALWQDYWQFSIDLFSGLHMLAICPAGNLPRRFSQWTCPQTELCLISLSIWLSIPRVLPPF